MNPISEINCFYIQNLLQCDYSTRLLLLVNTSFEIFENFHRELNKDSLHEEDYDVYDEAGLQNGKYDL